MRALEALMMRHCPEFSQEVRNQVFLFQKILISENKIQNLTRLVEDEAFFFGHLVDVLELHQTKWLEGHLVDLGSGAGVPGLLAALISSSEWILIESEKKKAEYLVRAVASLGVGERVQVFPGRIEDYLKNSFTPTHPEKVFEGDQTIVARAVGSVGRIYNWIRDCSTWNNLLLFKGPAWDEEWKSFYETSVGKELQILGVYDYLCGPEHKVRKIVKLGRSGVAKKNR